MTKPAVEFRDIEMRFGDKVALSGVDLTVNRGDFVVLLGPSGGGKTTLLNILGGFLEPTRGEVLIDGKPVTGIPPAKRPTTTVFQDYALFPHMSVAGNVAFGLKMQHVPRAEQDRRVGTALAMVGLDHLGQRRIHELSGGQRQRIALARALAVEPSVLLLDEPLGALDMKLRRQMQNELKAIQKRVGTTFVHVTHDQEEAMAIADLIVVMNDGFIEDKGKPERIYLRPASRFTADFMGESNFIDGKVAGVSGSSVRVETPLGAFDIEGEAAPGAAVTLSLRPEHLRTDGGGDRSLGRASVLESGFFGTHHQCTAKLAAFEVPFKARLPQRETVTPGTEVEFSVDLSDIVLLTR
ncbi:MAG: ABC transporter ATP-binding protein [Rhodospirillales bacterium]